VTIYNSTRLADNLTSSFFFDVPKTRIQIGNKNPFRLSGLYGGVGGSLVGQLPYGVLTFGSYEIYKKSLRERFPNVNPVFTYAMAAVLGDLTGSGWLCPSEVVKQQMQAGMFTSTREALVSIWKQKGIAGLYQGYWGSVARDVPFRVAQLTSYEVTKSVYLKWKASRRHQRMSDTGDDSKLELSPIESALCGALAGTFSAAVTCPLDRIKTLLMTNSAAYGGSVFSCASIILSEEGLAGFGPSCGIHCTKCCRVFHRL
jgi:solute carrier family 25 S-adenosylmethionine transporter 26